MATASSVLKRGSRPGGSTVEKYFRFNGKATTFVKDWLRLTAKGDCDWSLVQVLQYLKSDHGFGGSRSGLHGWLERHHLKAYDRVRGRS